MEYHPLRTTAIILLLSDPKKDTIYHMFHNTSYVCYGYKVSSKAKAFATKALLARHKSFTLTLLLFQTFTWIKKSS